MTDDFAAPSADETIGRDALVTLCREKLAQGATQDDIIVFLHAQGASLDGAATVFREFFGGSFGETKALFWKHSVWHDEIEAVEELTMDFIECFGSDDSSDENSLS